MTMPLGLPLVEPVSKVAQPLEAEKQTSDTLVQGRINVVHKGEQAQHLLKKPSFERALEYLYSIKLYIYTCPRTSQSQRA